MIFYNLTPLNLLNMKFGQHNFFPEPKVALTKDLVYLTFSQKLWNSTVIINLARRQCTYSRCLVQNAEIKRRILLHTFRYILWCHWRKKSKQWRNEFRYCSWSKVDSCHCINEIELFSKWGKKVGFGQIHYIEASYGGIFSRAIHNWLCIFSLFKIYN